METTETFAKQPDGSVIISNFATTVEGAREELAEAQKDLENAKVSKGSLENQIALLQSQVVGLDALMLKKQAAVDLWTKRVAEIEKL